MVSLSNDEYTKIIVFIVIGCILGGIIEFLLKILKLQSIPYVVIVFYCGLLLSLIQRGLNINDSPLISDASVSSEVIIFLLLPALLFSETMHLNWYLVRNAFFQSALLAGPGGLVVATQLALICYYCLPFGWSWNYSFLFGAIMSATDPVSVVNLLKTSNASSSLSTIIAGESLLNDGSAMILFFLFFNLIEGKTYTAVTFIEFIASMLLLSPLIGFAFGLAAYLLSRQLSTATNLNIDLQIIITFIAGYGSFFVAQGLLDVSGVLACCSAGVTVSFLVNPAIVEHNKMHEIWSVVEWACNTLIFLLGGFLGGSKVERYFNGQNFGLVIMIFVFLLITRTTMIALFYPMVSNIGMKLNPAEAVFVIYAGLRGALAIALASVAAGYTKDHGSDHLAGEFFFMVSGVVSLTLLINGSTAGWLLVKLKLVDDPNAPVSEEKQRVMQRVTPYMRHVVNKEIKIIKHELGDYDSNEVARLCKVLHSDELSDSTNNSIDTTNSESLVVSNNETANDNNNSDIESSIVSRDSSLRPWDSSIDSSSATNNDLLPFLRTTFLRVLQARYMDSIHTGKIGTSVTASKILLSSIDFAMDSVHKDLTDWSNIETNLLPNKVILRILQSIDNIFSCVGILSGLVSWYDTVNERIAMYVLINFIDAHEFTLKKMCAIFLDDNNNYPGTRRRSFEPMQRIVEGTIVIKESKTMIKRARELLSTIPPDVLRSMYTVRAAKIILIKQEEILQGLLTSGVLSNKIAHPLLDAVQYESKNVNVERANYDRTFQRETFSRKKDEERLLRASVRQSNLADKATDDVVADAKAAASISTHNNNSNDVLPSRTSLREVLTGEGVLMPSISFRSSFRPSLQQSRNNNISNESNIDRDSELFTASPLQKISSFDGIEPNNEK